ncbi:MAG TPA: response regulator, partial [Oceanospirillales bacterium]|nr:response regulator [Oceanospirillales bacterium]
QDDKGYMWFATKNGLARFDGYKFNIIHHGQGKTLGNVLSIINDVDGSLLIASRGQGLFRYYQGELKHIEVFSGEIRPEISALGLDQNNRLWIGTNEGIYRLLNGKASKLLNFHNEKSYSFINLGDSKLLVQTIKKIYKFDINTGAYTKLSVLPKDQYNNYVLHQDAYNNIWLGRTNGLYLFNKDCDCFQESEIKLNGIKIYSMVSDDKYLWIGSIYHGLYRYSYKSKELVHLKHDYQKQNSLSDDSVYSLYIDRSKVVWVGTFHAGVNFINPNNLEFDTISAENHAATCAKNFITHAITVSKNKDIWLATENGLVKISNTDECTLFNYNPNDDNSLSYDALISLYQQANGDIWIMNEKGGIDKISANTGVIKRLGSAFNDISFYFATEYNEGVLVLGSHEQGLYLYDIKKGTIERVKSTDKKFYNASFYSYTRDNDGRYYFGTSKGIVHFNANKELEEYEINFDKKRNFEVNAISFDQNNNLWLGLDNQYFIKITKENNLENMTAIIGQEGFPLKLQKIVPLDNYLWISSNTGIYKIDTDTNKVWVFTARDGLQNTEFLSTSFYLNKDGKLYFGGKKGVNSFYPEQISINNRPPAVVLTAFNYFNKKLEVGVKTDSSLQLHKPIDYLEQIELGYKDYIIGFEFAALDYADSLRNKYAYRLLGLNDSWVQVDASDRKATYTNLKAGDYVFQVKAANKDGAWSTEPKEIKIRVHPAPWLSPWAFAAYFLAVILSIWAFIRYKTISSRKRAKQLEVTVKQRTQEVNMQKKMVESLLDHKNEVFANVTHEFKTPLALILGPIEQLAKKPELKKYDEALNMVQRNAKRLMLMVGQILKLSQAEVDKEIIREPQAVQATLIMLYESFKPLANDKNITLTLDNNHDVNIYATPECLEIVVGNLLSNALKFTAAGGEIQLRTVLANKRISISVKDTGTGIEQKDLDKVFNRFVRLDTHKSIQGTGIGLSVVKEITQANDGNVTVESQWGKGSEFTVTFALSAVGVEHDLTHDMVDQLVANTQNEMSQKPRALQPVTHNRPKNRVTVLIIEDNLDMQAHIGSVLEKRFNCLFADRGRAGIATALKEVPDVVICDVMMPGMDGYQVTRILRHDSRTSHIPIILLTALNTKESRIKGWREHIDVYVTKPFDATELNVQLDNILTIRKILQKNTNKALKTNEPLNDLDLPKQDLKFIEKFRDIIATHYANEYFQKADISAKMAVSERQLQRKIKALIGENPMDIMRDYRLEKASMKLKDGYQVSLVSDECGFGSVSYFGKCFKRRYGVTPKKYQQMAK